VTRAELAEALRRLIQAGIRLEGALDHGVREAQYLRDPDGTGVELSWDRPKSQWPRTPGGGLNMVSELLNLEALLKEGPDATNPAHD
jgi:catechol 2,3-dioxygenase